MDTVICVGGVDVDGIIWEGSSVGDNNGRIWPPMLPRNSPDEKPEVVAPAHKVPVIMPGNGWGCPLEQVLQQYMLLLQLH